MLPHELWQTVLRYAISVPVFLDAGAVDSISPLMINYPNVEWNNSKPYWAAERTRNSLRRVCNSWDQYLRHYGHRFIRMFDVVHGTFPAHHLHAAVRISLGDHIKLCCKKCTTKDYWPGGEDNSDETTDDSYQQLCRLIFHRFHPIKVQILDFGNSDIDMFELLCPLPPSALPNLVILQAAYIAGLETAFKLINSIPRLRHCFVKCHWGSIKDLSLKSSSLTTLFFPFCSSIPSSDYFTEDKFYLPALRHLYMTLYGYAGSYGASELWWLALLKTVGKELRSLYLPIHGYVGVDLPGDIWSLCPKLELLHCSMKLSIPPPPEHPLHTLSIPNMCLQGSCSLPGCIPDWPGIRTIRVNGQWARLLDRLKLDSLNPRLRVEDAFGESYSEYVSRVGSTTG
ncbi:hypothetical protein CPB86DRAFT_778602 [Serendipita vermifera]|nr:hypothetical protein CPB86DRAFT_778602 [Serendipita vermifera]